MPYIGNLPAEAYSSVVKDTFNGDGSTVAFTMSQPSTTNNVRVVVENVIQDPSVAYTCSGTTLTFTSAPPVGTANIYIIHLGPAVQTVTPPTEIGNATTYTSDLTVQGAFTSQGIDDNATSTAMTLDSSGNVGIGVAPTFSAGGSRKLLQITNGASGGQIAMGNNSNESENPRIFSDADNLGFATATTGGGIFQFYTGGSERVSITTSGSFYIGEATAISSGDGQRINLSSGSSGNYIRFKWAGSEYGSITLSGSGIALNSANALVLDGNPSIKLGINGSTRIIMDSDEFYPNGDNFMTLGWSGGRYVQLYAVSGSINTSDANEKQDVAELDEAEKRVATAAKGLIRKFRWIDAVEAKGDDARIHVGIIAQDLKAAFEAEGLDAHRYGMFCSDTWWEADEVIPAVEEVVDEEGNIITEAQPERTETRTYRVAEEAPEGAVERTRLGVRYSELLAFIIGAM